MCTRNGDCEPGDTARLLLALSSVVGVAVGLGPGPAVAAPPVADATARCQAAGADRPSELMWVDDDEVLVDRRRLLDVRRGVFTTLSWPLVVDEAGGQRRYPPYAISPSGVLVAVVDAGGLRVGRLRDAPPPPLPLPPLPAGATEEREAAVAFRSDREVVVSQHRRYGGTPSRCDAYDRKSRSWRPLDDPCLVGDLPNVYHVATGPEHLVAVFSHGEGHPGFRFARLGERGQRPLSPEPTISLYDSASLAVTFARTKPVAWLTTFCPLERAAAGVTHPCLDDEGTQLDDGGPVPWRLYRWQVGSARLEPSATNLPSEAVAAPDGATLAWPSGACVCVGDRTGRPRACLRPTSTQPRRGRRPRLER